ncbi:MAG: hydrogenase/urease maturation nickel metallochaperone HypA [bacterium]|nr:hydrogenase/urease maturation nickel metallochaperone HypA [bacterium]MCX7916764.1 hydrogenase/urease maturation nickel metallochaperone HypA [bacterium]MDW8164347.1 hydrogenase maturation nickel metallochaperone HypA [Candidatus Omnitrophota bacterium]
MHELSIINNLIKIIEEICKENNAKKLLKINLKINPYSCLDEENLNFIFSSLTKGNKIYEGAQIHLERTLPPSEREYIIENIEIEV